MLLFLMTNLLLLAVCPTDAGELKQTPDFILAQPNRKSHRFYCELGGGLSVDSTIIHWYQEKKGEGLKRILYRSASGDTHNDEGFKDRFTAGTVKNKNQCVLTVSSPQVDDSATYYCAYWDTVGSYAVKVFGSGTKLVVSDTPLTKPTVTVFPPSSENGQVTLVCLAEKYFPDVIKIEWKKKDTIVSEAKAQLEKDKASIVLKVADDEDFVSDHYSCQVTHEALTNGPHVEVLTKIKAQPVKKETGPVNASTCPPEQYTDDEKKETISLSPFDVDMFAYTLLILKSAMYFGIISVLTYKIKSAQALGVKKRVP